MTTIRELCEAKNFELAIAGFVKLQGNIPMCCFKTRKSENAFGYEIQCNWTEKWFPPDEFSTICRGCQIQIERMIKAQIIWALEHTNSGSIEEMVRASAILRPLSAHPEWSSALVNHRCPLCGYETTATNVHRHCPENPTESAVPMYVVEENKGHFREDFDEELALEEKAIRNKKKSRRTNKGTFHGKSRGKYKGRDQ